MASATGTASRSAIERVSVAACTIPTDAPESDGTLEWSSTTIVLVEAEAAGVRGLGYTYADTSAATTRVSSRCCSTARLRWRTAR